MDGATACPINQPMQEQFWSLPQPMDLSDLKAVKFKVFADPPGH